MLDGRWKKVIYELKVLTAPGLMVCGLILPNGLFNYEIMLGKQHSVKYIKFIM